MKKELPVNFEIGFAGDMTALEVVCEDINIEKIKS